VTQDDAVNQLAAIRIFAKVAECLNFAEAAKQLGISNSAVTRSVAVLEQHLRVRLVNRTTRRASLTAAGQSYSKHCEELLRQISVMDEFMATAAGQTGGSLRIASSSSYASIDLLELLAAYRLQEPRMQFELTVFDNMTDDIMANSDVCFSAERGVRDSSLVCRPLAQTRDVIVACPAYLSRRGLPRTPLELSSHDVLVTSDAPGRYWDFRDKHGTQRVEVRPILNTQSPLLVKRAVQAGLGIARLSMSLIQSELSDGTLRPLLTHVELCGDERPVWLFYSGQPRMALTLRRFIDFVVERYRQSEAEENKEAVIPV
jgi:DNA-binding transcriptional LysR family regulator